MNLGFFFGPSSQRVKNLGWANGEQVVVSQFEDRRAGVCMCVCVCVCVCV